MLTPLLLTLALLHQAPAAPQEPISVLIAPPDTAGVPKHVVDFAQEHIAEQTKSKGLRVVRMKDMLRKVPGSKRRALLRCKRTELKCLTALGQAAKTDVVLVAELLQRMDGYRVGTKIYMTDDGGLVAENIIPGVREDGMLDALTQSLDVVVPRMVQKLRPPPTPPPETKPPETKPPETKPPETKPPETKPPETKPPETKPPETKPPETKPPETKPPTAEAKLNLRRWAWVPAVAGVALAGTGTYFYLQAKDRYDTLNTGQTGLPLDGPKLVSEGRQKQNLSRIFFGLGAASLVTGGVFYLFPGDEKPVHPTVLIGPNGGMVGVAGTLP